MLLTHINLNCLGNELFMKIKAISVSAIAFCFWFSFHLSPSAPSFKSGFSHNFTLAFGIGFILVICMFYSLILLYILYARVEQDDQFTHSAKIL